jgi:ParB family chromosome partitioning protein
MTQRHVSTSDVAGAPNDSIAASDIVAEGAKSSATDEPEPAAVSLGSTASANSAKMVHCLDPRTIRVSAWANRHRRSFSSPEFEKLKASIALVGVNIQPIKVRPLAAPIVKRCQAKASPGPSFEVVFGHRRHRACLDLGISVAAVIQPLSDQELFAEMDRENRTQKPLSPFEQGCMFKQALDEGLYASARALAQELDVDSSLVSKALSIARLPEQVIQAFESPLDIQYRWAGPLNEAHRQDPVALIARAEILSHDAGKRSSVRVFQCLVASRRPSVRPAAQISGRSCRASMQVDRRGRLTVVIDEPWGPEVPTALETALREILNQR